MKIHQLYYRQSLNISRHEAWKFFTSPLHLNTITPDFFTITPVSKVPEKIYSGLMIAYTLKAVFNWPMAWLSEISHCETEHYFIYEQRIGPFKFWSHEVRLTQQINNILVEDIVFYAMPFGLLGRLCHQWIIADKLADIFNTRRDYLAERWDNIH
ncbi:MAG: SRPBCC family protein [Gammaproteobacteria bacterium]|jgi:ligand-binding SRPBCC domain-containing protein|nr:SRPBCC family protein [Gammaproteobacteria bacterium]MBT4147408.1 SRPBCC family protein [Gammaproteobacteria bacterium]MBT5223754.1 SRPBCC family protein [Gammaproteobacteria bacterium]MBT5826693.1 SRPBCC family protein [Gammaproteobacteria bacterium]MBT5966799.1 SRPBCC family protein [Gammaproteobacteria bacterium]